MISLEQVIFRFFSIAPWDCESPDIHHIICLALRQHWVCLIDQIGFNCSSVLSVLSYLPTPPLGQDMTQGQFLSGVSQVSIQSFPSPRLVASPRLKILVCPTILPIAGGRIIGFIPFQRVLVLCEMQSVSSRIWTRVAVSISYDDNHYTTGIFLFYKSYFVWDDCD